MAEKVLQTRIINKHADLQTWLDSTLPLKTGEIALARVETTKPDDHGGFYTVPTYLMKVGDGDKTFSQLEWLAAPASDVYEWAKAATKPGYTASEISFGTDSTVNAAITALQNAVGADGSVADAIKAAIEALDVTDEAVANQFVTAVAEADGKISVTRRALTADDIPELAQSKITGLTDAIEAINNKFADYNTTAAQKAIDDAQDAEIAKKVDKVEGKSLVLDTEIEKLAGVSEGANKVEASANGKIKIDGVDTTVYTHPDKHTIAEVEGLQDALDGKSDDGHKHVAADITDLDATIKGYDYATKTDAQGYANAKDEAIAAAKKAGDDAAAALDTYKGEMTTALAGKQDVIPENTYDAHGSAAKALEDAKQYTDGEIAKIPAQTDYTVTITENTDDATVAKTYVFTQCGEEIGAIKLAKELVVTSGTVKEVETVDVPYTGAKVGDKYIELVIANQDTPIYVPAKDLVDIYTAKDGAAEVQVAISNTNEISATLVNGGVTEEKLAEGVKTKLNKTWEEVGVAKGLVDALADGQVKTNTEAIALKANTADVYAKTETYNKEEVDAAIEAAKTDASNKDTVVLAEAQSYADTKKTEAVAEAAASLKTYTDANDARVATVETTFAKVKGSQLVVGASEDVIIFDCGGANAE